MTLLSKSNPSGECSTVQLGITRNPEIRSSVYQSAHFPRRHPSPRSLPAAIGADSAPKAPDWIFSGLFSPFLFPAMTASDPSATLQLPRKPLKQQMATSLKSFGAWLSGGSPAGGGPAPIGDLFAKTDPATDGDGCLHDCDSCTVKYPRGFKIDESDVLYGQVKAWSTHLIVGTGKADWVRDVSDEKGSVMEAVDKAESPSNGVSRTRGGDKKREREANAKSRG